LLVFAVFTKLLNNFAIELEALSAGY
jgi:hypothetical protein